MEKKRNSVWIYTIAALLAMVGICLIVKAYFATRDGLLDGANYYKIGGLLTAAAVALLVLKIHLVRQSKKKKNRYHAVHWDNGRITRDE